MKVLRYLYYKFSMPKFAKGNNSIDFFFTSKYTYHLLSADQADSYNSFRDIFLTSYACPNLQRAITRRIKFNNFYYIFTSKSTHYLLMKLLALIVFEIF